MPASPSEPQRALALAAGIALALMLVVVASSAFIRFSLAADASAALPASLTTVRGVHRAAASLTAVAVLVLAVLAWRSPAPRARIAAPTGAALLLTLGLSALGVATGTTPPPGAQFANLFGGLVLLGLLAWLGGRAGARVSQDAAPLPDAQRLARLVHVALALGVVQAALGAAQATLWSPADALVLGAHVFTGLATAALAFALGIRLASARRAIAFGLIGAACAAPLAGTLSALIDLAPAAALVHPLLGAATLALLARFDGGCGAPPRLA